MKWPRILRKLHAIDTNKLLKDYIVALKRRYPNSTIVLFGSRAKRNNLPYSDYDIAIIFRRVVNKISIVIEAYKGKPSELALDIVVLEEDEIEDPLIRKMLEKCIILYDGLGIRRKLPCKTTL